MSVQVKKDEAEAIRMASEVKRHLSEDACLISRPTVSYPSGKMTLREVREALLESGASVSGKQIDNHLQWFPPSALQVFNTLRKQAYETFESISVAVGSFNIVPMSELESVMGNLKVKKAKYDGEVKDLLASYKQHIEAYAGTFKDETVQNFIRKAGDKFADDFRAVFAFEVYPALAIQPLNLDDEMAMQHRAKEALWQDVAKLAREHLSTSFKEGKQPVAGSVNGLARIKDKLVSLSFLDHGIDRVVDCCCRVIDSLPKTGRLSDSEVLVMTSFLTCISSVEALKATAANESSGGIDMTTVLKHLLPKAQAKPVSVEEIVTLELPMDTSVSTSEEPQQLFLDDEEEAATVEIVQEQLDWGGF